MIRRDFIKSVGVAISSLFAAPALLAKDRIRLSCREEYPGYAEWLAMRRRGKAPVVFLDGKEICDCIALDTGTCCVLKLCRDSDGDFLLNSSRDEVLIENLTGDISVSYTDAEWIE